MVARQGDGEDEASKRQGKESICRDAGASLFVSRSCFHSPCVETTTGCHSCNTNIANESGYATLFGHRLIAA